MPDASIFSAGFVPDRHLKGVASRCIICVGLCRLQGVAFHRTKHASHSLPRCVSTSLAIRSLMDAGTSRLFCGLRLRVDSNIPEPVAFVSASERVEEERVLVPGTRCQDLTRRLLGWAGHLMPVSGTQDVGFRTPNP